MKIDFKEITNQIDLQDFSGGKFDLDYTLPDGRSLNIIGNVTVNGTVYSSYEREPVFKGSVEFSLSDWTGYDPVGNEIPAYGSTEFENYMTNILNS